MLQVDKVEERSVQAEGRGTPVRQAGQFERQGRLRLVDQVFQPVFVDGRVGTGGRVR
ncbi:hypothetical protein ACWGQL_31285 [Streptomyces lydicus]